MPASKRRSNANPARVESLEPRVLLSAFMVTNSLDSGPGSLRDDVVMSDAAGGANTISFSPSLAGAIIILTSGQLEVSNDLAITGPGAASLTISGFNTSRVFQVNAGTTVAISGLTITDGHVPNGETTGSNGKNGDDGGGIYNLGSLTLDHDVISGNSAGSGGPGQDGGKPAGAGGSGGNGGGIYNAGTLTMNGDTITGNFAGAGGFGGTGAQLPVGPSNTDGAGGTGGNGGGIFSTGPIVLTGCMLSFNAAGSGGIGGGKKGSSGYTTAGGTGGNGGSGGAIYATSTLTFSECSIDHNSAGVGGRAGVGYGPANGGSGGSAGGVAGGTSVIGIDSTISNNSAGSGGLPFSQGGVAGAGGFGGGVAAADAALANCTISGNASSQGAGIESTGPLHLTNDTISGNPDGAGLYVAAGDALLNNTIVAGNDSTSPNDILGAVDPASAYNLIGNGDVRGLTASGHNLFGTTAAPINPEMGPLGNNGGPTATMLPRPGSPVIDAGSNALAVGPDGTTLATDQRGDPRIVDATHSGTPTVDIGAVEVPPLPASPLVVNSATDGLFDPTFDATHVSLREAVAIADLVKSPFTINFAAGLSGTILLDPSLGQVEFSNKNGPTVINGPGASILSISGNNASRVFQFDGGTNVEVHGLSITAGAGGSNDVGGGIYNGGTATLYNCIVSGNGTNGHLAYGGGVYNAPGSTITLVACTVTGNHVGTDGGGVYSAMNGTVSLIECKVSGNTSTQGLGGGIDNDGTLALSDSTVSANNAASGGGGICNGVIGTAFIVNTTIVGNQNHSNGDGGGIDNLGTLTLVNCTISDNTAFNGTGGGLALSGGLASIYNTIVGGNHNLVRADISGNLDYSYAAKQTQYTRSGPSSNNLISDGSGNLPFGMDGNPANGNLLGDSITMLDPRLAPLGDYGGPTQTMALRTGSPAIDAGSNALAVGPDPGAPGLVTDQRGYGRVFNGTVDIGAYEYGSSIPGDADGDGKVDFADFVLVARHYGQTNVTWSQGDFNGDGSVGFDDLLVVARNYGQSVSLTTAAATLNPTLAPAVADVQPADGWHKVVHHRRL